DVRLAHSLPGKSSPLLAQLVAQARELFFLRQELPARFDPLVGGYDLMLLRHASLLLPCAVLAGTRDAADRCRGIASGLPTLAIGDGPSGHGNSENERSKSRHWSNRRCCASRTTRS